MEERTDDITGDSAQGDPTPVTSTLSGLGIWTGLLPMAQEAYEDYDVDVREEWLVERIDRQFERYNWFADRIDNPRNCLDCARALSNPAQQPAGWERALVEMSLLDSPRAKLFLETWQPPEDDVDIDLFRRICAAKCEP